MFIALVRSYYQQLLLLLLVFFSNKERKKSLDWRVNFQGEWINLFKRKTLNEGGGNMLHSATYGQCISSRLMGQVWNQVDEMKAKRKERLIV